jgi:hypothetical protein
LEITASEFLINEIKKFLNSKKIFDLTFPYGGNDRKAANKKILIDGTGYSKI